MDIVDWYRIGEKGRKGGREGERERGREKGREGQLLARRVMMNM